MRAGKIIIFTLLFFLSFNSRAQNFIPNGSFEAYTSCTIADGQWNKCIGWNNVNLNTGLGQWGTPDYFMACGTNNTAPPATFAGTCMPQSGSAMMGLVLYNFPFPDYREYLAAQLNWPLQPGLTYTLSFWVSNGTGVESPWTISNIGAVFSAGPLSQTGYGVINATPQCEVQTNVANKNWTQYTFMFTAAAAWDHITIGNFKNDPNNNPVATYSVPGGPGMDYANYFFDNIELYGPCSGNGTPFTLSAAVTQPTTCGGMGSATITPSGTQQSVNYIWQPGNFTGAAVSGLSPGVYTVTGTSPCSSYSSSAVLTVISSNTLNVIANSTVACRNLPAQLTSTVSGGTAAYSYTWLPGGSNAPSISVWSGSNMTFTLLVKDNNNCTGQATALFSISSVTADFNFAADACKPVCTFSNSSLGGTSYLWRFGDNTSSTLVNKIKNYPAAGNYVVKLVAFNSNGCTDTVQKTVSVIQAVKSGFLVQPVPCSKNITISNTSAGASSYSWNFGDGASSSQAAPLTHSYTIPGNYTVSLMASDTNNCKDTFTLNLTVSDYNAASFSLCPGQCNRQFQFNSLVPLAATHSWQFGDGDASASVGPMHTFTQPGIYKISYAVNAALSCSSIATKTIQVSNSVVPGFDYSVGCKGMVTFSNTSNTTSASRWQFSNGQSSLHHTPSLWYDKPGDYSVTLINYSNASFCADTFQKKISVYFSSVAAGFKYAETPFNDEIAFTNLSTNEAYCRWDFGDGSVSSSFNPKHSFVNGENFMVCLVATDFKGCSDTACQVITPANAWTFYIPNTFSPDGDGKNDAFYAFGTNIHEFHITVFDRWGEPIFSSAQMEQGWDGLCNGQEAPNDIYAWKAEFRDPDNKVHHRSGHVQVLR